MQSPLKKAIVYDLETGGLSSKYNSITEIALVALDLDSLKIIDECSILLKPRIDLSNMEEDSLLEAKSLYKRLATKDEDTGIKTLMFGKEKITLKNIEPLKESIDKFKLKVKKEYKSRVLDMEDVFNLRMDGYEHIVNIYLDNSYNPQALEVTKIPLSLLIDEGVDYSEAFSIVNDFIKKHCVGNSKPIISGHNIKSFDNPFMEQFYKIHKGDFYKNINSLLIDTLEWARLKFWELPSFSLGVCANEVGLTLKEAHRALPDTIANAKFLLKLLKSLRGDGGKEAKNVRRKYKLNF